VMAPTWKHQGARSELVACVWLLDNGYEVFRNVSPCGDDLVAISAEGEIIRLDVKTCRGTYQKITDNQIKNSVLPIHVMDDGTCVIEHNPKGRGGFKRAKCEFCGIDFWGRKWAERFCSDKCRTKYRTGKKPPEA
jgi:hypothetical protein